ncbi:MAG: potassium-transporting ATPase subunit C [Erysipelothrix sp.]
MKKIIKIVIAGLCFVIVTGGIYPLLSTGVGTLVFSPQSKGSPIVRTDTIEGSKLLGQHYTKMDEFWGRPSASDYSGKPSGSSNEAIMSKEYKQKVKARIEALLLAHPDRNVEEIPAELLTESGSGLDPHISYEAVRFQKERVMQHLDISESELDQAIEASYEGKFINVVTLNSMIKK